MPRSPSSISCTTSSTAAFTGKDAPFLARRHDLADLHIYLGLAFPDLQVTSDAHVLLYRAAPGVCERL
jgi:hypothetical protein